MVTSEIPKVLVIIVNYNGKRYLKDCFDSLQNQTYKNFEVALIDNNSSDDSISFVREKYPFVKVFKMDKNLGFAEGNNVGMEWGITQQYQYVALLNNDTTAEPNWLTVLVAEMEKNEQLGAISSKLVFFKKFVPISIQSTSFYPIKELTNSMDDRALGLKILAGPVFSNVTYEKIFERQGWWPWEPSGFRWTSDDCLSYIPVEEHQDEYNLIIKISAPRESVVHLNVGKFKVGEFKLGEGDHGYKVFKIDPAIIKDEAIDIINNFGSQIDEYGYSRDIGFGQPDLGQYSETHYTNALCGANMLIRAKALKEVGLFNPYYFMYYEDVELCLRLKKHGWMLAITGDCIVRHIHSASSTLNPVTHYFIERNRILTLFLYGTYNQIIRGFKDIIKDFLKSSYRFSKSIIKLRQVRYYYSLWKQSIQRIFAYISQFPRIYKFRNKQKYSG